MPFKILRHDITQMTSDILVLTHSAQEPYSGRLEQAFLERGGPGFKEALKGLKRDKNQSLWVSAGYDLRSQYVFHVYIKPYQGSSKDKSMLKHAYEACLVQMMSLECSTIAFPLIGTGVLGYPYPLALQVAQETLKEFAAKNDVSISLVVYDDNAQTIFLANEEELIQYLKSSVLHNEMRHERSFERMLKSSSVIVQEKSMLNDSLDDLDDPFSVVMFRHIDTLGLSDSDVYRRANLDRRLFSKIRSNPQYQPSKNTAISIGLALKLDLDEFESFIACAGYTLSSSQIFDMIIRYHIENELYDIHEINLALYKFTEKTL